jgi:hypothetical protein
VNAPGLFRTVNEHLLMYHHKTYEEMLILSIQRFSATLAWLALAASCSNASSLLRVETNKGLRR